MRKEIGILLAWVVFLSGCVGKPMEKQNEQTKKEDAVLRLYTLKENENLWQSAKLFMEKYPKYPVVISSAPTFNTSTIISCNFSNSISFSPFVSESFIPDSHFLVFVYVLLFFH